MPHFAPVVHGGAEVDRIWKELLLRSGWVEPEATGDPDLHLLADGGRIDVHTVDFRMHGYQGVYRFRLDRPPRQLFIASRVCVPMRMGLNHDPRRLGVAIRSIRLGGEGAALDIDYDSDWLGEGFSYPEPDARHRWTTGWAPLPRRCHRLFDGPFELILDVVCTARYPLAEESAPTGHIFAWKVA